LGLLAGAITTGSLVPQVIRVFRLKSAREISLFFTLMFVLGDALWLVYGVIFKLPPVIFWNILAILLAGLLLYGKIRYDNHTVNDSNSFQKGKRAS
jgi:MtN3 and saliva related transmembrane protein